MFDKQFRIKQGFTSEAGALRRRFLLCGLLNLALAPFVAAFMLIYIFIKHAEEFRRREIVAHTVPRRGLHSTSARFT